jgi:hypothetical protein
MIVQSTQLDSFFIGMGTSLKQASGIRPGRGSGLRLINRRISKLNAYIAVAALIFGCGLFDLADCANGSDRCCRMRVSRNTPVITSHSCCERVEKQNGLACPRSAHARDFEPCCTLDPITSQFDLPQSISARTIASNQSSQTGGPNKCSNDEALIRRSSITNRGSTYLLCCVLLI